MICKGCNNQIKNTDINKYCPFCGVKLEDSHDTLEMPAITAEDIKRFKKGNFFKNFWRKIFRKKILLPFLTTFVIIATLFLGYKFVIAQPVSESQIRKDLAGETIVLPEGINFEIKSEYIKNFSISERNTDKKGTTDNIVATVVLDDGNILVNTNLNIKYSLNKSNQWQINDEITLSGKTTIKPTAVMNEDLLLEAVKKLNLRTSTETLQLSSDLVKSIKIVERNPDLENGKETTLIDIVLDNEIIMSQGEIKCDLKFISSKWSVVSVSTEGSGNFSTQISDNFNDEKVLNLIKTKPLNESISYSKLFGGTSFYVNDSFTKSMEIVTKNYDSKKNAIFVSVKRENTAGYLSLSLTTEYVLTSELTGTAITSISKTTVANANAKNMDASFIKSTISGVEAEGGSVFYLFSSNHKITAGETDTFSLDTILSKDNFQNVKYVYGNITYTKNKKSVKLNFVALYYLIYNETSGYSWKLDRIIGDTSPDYKTYNKANINQ